MILQNKYKTLLHRNGINTPLRIAHFMAQIDHESGLKSISENLNYSASGLLKTFKKYFTEDVLDKDSNIKIIGTATKYARDPIAIANKVYANRMGNGNELSGDGWKYRGRGFLQITGKDNYAQLSKDTITDFLNNPDLLLIEVNAMISALWFWKKAGLNALADKNDIVSLTKKINGGTNGLKHRQELLTKYLKQ